MSMNKMFSIIIPVYNGAGVVERALDTIYSQGLLQEELEVICVDDCSPTMETYEALNNYMYAGRHPENLLVVRHEVNKRQGGQETQHYSTQRENGFCTLTKMTNSCQMHSTL